MASIRTLPSGSIQASVLLETGRRQTMTFKDMADAHTWAKELETARDAERVRQRQLDQAAHTTITVECFCALAAAGQLSAAQVKAAKAALNQAEGIK